MKKTETTTIETVVESVATVKGRKVNPDSARQKRLIERAAKGTVVKGRPVKAESARQKRLAELSAKRESGELKKGRPVSGESARQKRIAEREMKAAAGILKKGRPAKLKEVSDVVELEKGEVVVAEVIEEVKAPVKKASKKK